MSLSILGMISRTDCATEMASYPAVELIKQVSARQQCPSAVSSLPYPDLAQTVVGLQALLIVGGRDDEVAGHEAEEGGEDDRGGGEGVDHNEQKREQAHQVAPQPRQPAGVPARGERERRLRSCPTGAPHREAVGKTKKGLDGRGRTKGATPLAHRAPSGGGRQGGCGAAESGPGPGRKQMMQTGAGSAGGCQGGCGEAGDCVLVFRLHGLLLCAGAVQGCVLEQGQVLAQLVQQEGRAVRIEPHLALHPAPRGTRRSRQVERDTNSEQQRQRARQLRLDQDGEDSMGGMRQAEQHGNHCDGQG